MTRVLIKASLLQNRAQTLMLLPPKYLYRKQRKVRVYTISV